MTTFSTTVLVVILVARWTFTGYLIVDMAGDLAERRNPVAYARLRRLRGWWTWPCVFFAAPITIASDALTMVTGLSFWHVLTVLLDGWIVWYAWTHRDDDDPWKRAGKRAAARVMEAGHRLVVVPVGGES